MLRVSTDNPPQMAPLVLCRKRARYNGLPADDCQKHIRSPRFLAVPDVAREACRSAATSGGTDRQEREKLRSTRIAQTRSHSTVVASLMSRIPTLLTGKLTDNCGSLWRRHVPWRFASGNEVGAESLILRWWLFREKGQRGFLHGCPLSFFVI
jgi:hypothetical protein